MDPPDASITLISRDLGSETSPVGSPSDSCAPHAHSVVFVSAFVLSDKVLVGEYVLLEVGDFVEFVSIDILSLHFGNLGTFEVGRSPGVNLAAFGSALPALVVASLNIFVALESFSLVLNGIESDMPASFGVVVSGASVMVSTASSVNVVLVSADVVVSTATSVDVVLVSSIPAVGVELGARDGVNAGHSMTSPFSSLHDVKA